MKRNRIIPLILVLMLFVLVACDVRQEPTPTPTPGKTLLPATTPRPNKPGAQLEIGDEVPDIAFTLLDGTEVKLSDFRGKVIFMNFWATWCTNCIQEMDSIQQLQDNHPDDVVVLAMNCSEQKADVQAYIDDNGFTFRVGMEENFAISGDIFRAFSIPTTYIIDAEGKVAFAYTGAVTLEGMEEAIKIGKGDLKSLNPV